MLEVVGVRGAVHLGQIQSGLFGGIRLAQGGRVSNFYTLKYWILWGAVENTISLLKITI